MNSARIQRLRARVERLERLHTARLKRQAGVFGEEILYSLIDRDKLFALKRQLRTLPSNLEDRYSVVLMEVQEAFIQALEVTLPMREALNRFRGLLQASAVQFNEDRLRDDLRRLAEALKVSTKLLDFEAQR